MNLLMNITLIDLLNKKLDVSMRGASKMPFLYFLFFFSVLIVLFFPFYIKGHGNRLIQLLVVSLFLGIIVYLVSIIYMTGGFNV